MDMGQRGKMMNARDLTAEIDRMTDAAAGLAESREVPLTQNETPGGVDANTAQALGRGALLGGSEAGVSADGGNFENAAFEQVDNTGKASVEAAVELSEAMGEVTNPLASVGMVSEIEKEEFEQRDMEIAENEADPRRSFVAEIEYKNQEAVAKSVAPAVDRRLHEKRFELVELLELYREGRNKTLDVIGHPIGKDN